MGVISHPHSLFAEAKETITLNKTGRSELTLRRFSKLIGIGEITPLQARNLSTMPDIQLISYDMGYSIFKLTDPAQVTAILASGVAPEQIKTPLYTGASTYDQFNLRIPNGTIYLCFKEGTAQSVMEEIIKEHKLRIVPSSDDEDTELGYGEIILQCIDPLHDPVKLVCTLQENPNIRVVSPHLERGIQTYTDPLTSTVPI